MLIRQNGGHADARNHRSFLARQGTTACAALVCTSAISLAQSWVEFGVPGPERCGVNLAFDEARGEVVMRSTSHTGGDTRTFTWDGQQWTDRGFGVVINQTDVMVYDDARERVTMVTGNRGVFVWDGSEWMRDLVGEPNIIGPAIAYDSNREQVLLWGNGDEPGTSSELWAWDGDFWRRLWVGSPPISPGATMAYDPQSDQLVLIGGTNLAVTWVWDGISWTRVDDRAHAFRNGHSMAFDSVNGEIIVFGGRKDGEVLTDTWAWDGAAWRLRSENGPAQRWDHGMAFDSIRGEMVLFGGFDGDLPCFADTWVWRNCQADLDDDNDADAEDFFLYLDLFAAGDDRADLDDDGDLDADDYQLYLDRFAMMC